VPADNLGSIAVITNEAGAVVERDGYDAWGKRCFPNGADDPTGSLTSQTTRGFTGQEELSEVGLMHLNGRVYDPLVARMTSADPMVPDPMNGQAWNRYSYVANNPLTFTDPSGYCFLGCGTWSNLGKMQPGTLFRQNPMLGSVVEIAAAGICGMMTAGGCIPSVVAVLASATVAGITSGRLGKDVLRAGVTTAATVAAFYVVGGMTNVVAGQAFGADHIQPAFGTGLTTSTSWLTPRSGVAPPSLPAESAAPARSPEASPRPQDLSSTARDSPASSLTPRLVAAWPCSAAASSKTVL
jgi:RHS repeat-associated protein